MPDAPRASQRGRCPGDPAACLRVQTLASAARPLDRLTDDRFEGREVGRHTIALGVATTLRRIGIAGTLLRGPDAGLGGYAAHGPLAGDRLDAPREDTEYLGILRSDAGALARGLERTDQGLGFPRLVTAGTGNVLGQLEYGHGRALSESLVEIARPRTSSRRRDLTRSAMYQLLTVSLSGRGFKLRRGRVGARRPDSAAASPSPAQRCCGTAWRRCPQSPWTR